MSKLAERISALSPVQRRRALQLLGLMLGAPALPGVARLAARQLALSDAHAQAMAGASLFLELDFRNQVDLMHVMVPPSIARYPNRSVGVNGEELCLFAPESELKEFPNEVFLTNDSLELAPHIDSVAMLDTGEPGIGGIHGHEAGNGMRSPGRVMDGGASGLPPMYLNDATNGNWAGNEMLYASAPTPATFHNYYQKKLGSDALNGLAFKGNAYTRYGVYHYGAGYPEAELTRVHSKAELFEQYGALSVDPINGVPSGLIDAILAQPAVPYRKASGAGYTALVDRFKSLDVATINQLELTASEAARWSEGVPAQQCTEASFQLIACPADVGDPNELSVKAEIWEQFGYASKLFRSGSVRSIALEFDFGELHGDGTRPELVLRTQAQQVARPLARLISDLKAAGLYDRTVIAVYTLDGSRRPAANSFGNDGKGTILLAGGRIKGGYYGDISITGELPTSGHSYAYRPPDPTTGELLPAVSNWQDIAKRTPSGSVWRTVMKALGIPETEYVGKFNSQIDDAVALDFMLRS